MAFKICTICLIEDPKCADTGFPHLEKVHSCWGSAVQYQITLLPVIRHCLGVLESQLLCFCVYRAAECAGSAGP